MVRGWEIPVYLDLPGTLPWSKDRTDPLITEEEKEWQTKIKLSPKMTTDVSCNNRNTRVGKDVQSL